MTFELDWILLGYVHTTKYLFANVHMLHSILTHLDG